MTSESISLTTFIGRDFELEDNITDEKLRKAMIHAFGWLLDNDISKMMNILYRADVDEEKLKELLINKAELPSAEVIADAYLARQIQKLETWRKYSR
ncbi:hypothetical protein [Pedobacter duraquae]|uniref:Uncharacterized protein n=1 Tax=Pedobacter duraquae TaxID=425511 RepID=A0A4R6IPY4_9SPHI|nr:hypothetical protein [Pedobacter duraquae]TDO24384.1 hypothetical protein CLV32_0673 [Pedobacter duraquae]